MTDGKCHTQFMKVLNNMIDADMRGINTEKLCLPRKSNLWHDFDAWFAPLDELQITASVTRCWSKK